MLDKDQIRDYLDKMNVPSRLDKDGDLMVTLEADESFASDVIVCIIVENANRLSFIAAAPDFNAKGNLLDIVNEHNKRNNFPTAVVRDNHIRLEYSFLINEDVSDQYIIQDCIQPTLSSIWTSYVGMKDM